jgi:hypothetical protein
MTFEGSTKGIGHEHRLDFYHLRTAYLCDYGFQIVAHIRARE